MTTFEFEQIEGVPDRAFVEVDGKYSVVIVRTDEGITIDVYPKDWDAPIDTMGVCDNDVTAMEQEAEEAA
jgi:hypothetical protein